MALSGCWCAEGVESGEAITETFLLHHDVAQGRLVGTSMADSSEAGAGEGTVFDMEGSVGEGNALTLRQHFRARPEDKGTVCLWDAVVVAHDGHAPGLQNGRWSGDGIDGSFTARRTWRQASSPRSAAAAAAAPPQARPNWFSCLSAAYATSTLDCFLSPSPVLTHRYEAGDVVRLLQLVVLESRTRRGRTKHGWIRCVTGGTGSPSRSVSRSHTKTRVQRT
eukprot:SAG22_NODE_451_length_10354_cov_5.184983_5_plen_222_part_00